MSIASDAAAFVENHIIIGHSETPAVYVKAYNKFMDAEDAKEKEKISKEMWARADIEKNKMFQRMMVVRAKLVMKGQRQYAAVDLRKYSWEQVMTEVNETAQSSKPLPGSAKLLKQCLDKVGENADTFESWLSLLPAGDYGASICGVFKLAIGAARAFSKVEDSVLKILSDIPEIMHEANKYVQIYRDYRDHTLEVRTFNLYVAILKALQHVMQFFGESSSKRLFDSIAKQSAYKSELMQALDEVRRLVGKISEEATQCFQLRLADMDKAGEQGRHQILSELKDMKADMKAKNLVLQAIYRQLASHPAFRDKEQDWSDNTSRKAIEDTRSVVRLSRSPVPYEGNSAYIKPKKLYKLMEYDHEVVSRDLDTCLKMEYVLNEKAKAYTAAVIHQEKFREWLTENCSSRALLINGCNDEDTNFESPFSFLCAEIVQTCLASGSAFVLSFFCKCHTGYGGDSTRTNAAGMMTSLVGQLLSQMRSRGQRPYLHISKTDSVRVRDGDVEILCDMFRELVFQLPKDKILICVLDEVSLYESGEMYDDTNFVIRDLMHLVSNTQNAVFKLLVACYGHSLEVHRHFDEDDILHLEERPEANTSGLWNIGGL